MPSQGGNVHRMRTFPPVRSVAPGVYSGETECEILSDVQKVIVISVTNSIDKFEAIAI